MNLRFLVYGLLDPRDGTLRYVGKSSYGLTRPRSHFCPSRLSERTHKGHWIKSVVSAGMKPEVFILEEHLDESRLNEAEEFFIAYFRAIGCRLTNATKGGEGARGVIPSEETRAKMSAVRRGRKNTPEHCAAIAVGLKGHAVSGETRAKMAAIHKGNKYCVGRKVSEATLVKMSESAKRTSAMRGQSHSEEVRAKIREAARRRARSSDGTFKPKSSLDR